MQEAVRLQYLALLGIEQWRLRDDPAIATAVATDTAGSVQVSEDSGAWCPPAAGAGHARESQIPASAPGTPGDRSTKPSTSPPPVPPPSLPIPPQEAANEPPARVVAAGLRIGCAFAELPDGLLLIAACARPDDPGLSGSEQVLLHNIVGALAPGHLLRLDEVHWPPRGMRLPNVDRPGAAEDFLAEMFAKFQRRGLRDVVVFGDSLVDVIGRVCAMRGLAPPAGVPSLAAMHADPALKRDCWTRLKPFRRNPTA